MTKLTFTKLVGKWPSVGEFADDMLIFYETARKMRSRNSVGVRHWKRLLCVAKDRGFKNDDGKELNYADLLRMKFDSLNIDGGKDGFQDFGRG